MTRSGLGDHDHDARARGRVSKVVARIRVSISGFRSLPVGPEDLRMRRALRVSAYNHRAIVSSPSTAWDV